MVALFEDKGYQPRRRLAFVGMARLRSLVARIRHHPWLQWPAPGIGGLHTQPTNDEDRQPGDRRLDSYHHHLVSYSHLLIQPGLSDGYGAITLARCARTPAC